MGQYVSAGVVSNCGNIYGIKPDLQDQGGTVRHVFYRYNYNCNCVCNC
jgi:hypothetical protein